MNPKTYQIPGIEDLFEVALVATNPVKISGNSDENAFLYSLRYSSSNVLLPSNDANLNAIPDSFEFEVHGRLFSNRLTPISDEGLNLLELYQQKSEEK